MSHFIKIKGEKIVVKPKEYIINVDEITTVEKIDHDGPYSYCVHFSNQYLKIDTENAKILFSHMGISL